MFDDSENTLNLMDNFPLRPYDLAHIPDILSVEDSPGQQTALQAVFFAPESDTDEETRFYGQVQYSKSLKFFERLYKEKQSHMALDLLSKRVKVDFRSDSFLTPADDNMIAWDTNHHYLDMMVCVGNGLGLCVIILN